MRSKVEANRDAAELLVDMIGRLRSHFVNTAFRFDLTPPQMGVITHLDELTSMGNLASAIGCDASNITWMTDRLEQRGLVERRPDPNDRRVKRLVLTEAGRKLRREIDRRLRADLPGLDRLSPDEQATLARLLSRMLESD